MLFLLCRVTLTLPGLNSFQNDASSAGCAGRVRCEDAGSPNSSAIRATEDDAACRTARPADSRLRVEMSSLERVQTEYSRRVRTREPDVLRLSGRPCPGAAHTPFGTLDGLESASPRFVSSCAEAEAVLTPAYSPDRGTAADGRSRTSLAPVRSHRLAVGLGARRPRPLAGLDFLALTRQPVSFRHVSSVSARLAQSRRSSRHAASRWP
jgi:hypothetical protein